MASSHRKFVAAVLPGAGGTQVTTGPTVIFGATLTQTDGSTYATLNLDNSASGADSTDRIRFRTTANTSMSMSWEPAGILYTNGLWVGRVATKASGTYTVTYLEES